MSDENTVRVVHYTDQDVIAAIDSLASDDFCADLDMVMAFHPEQLTEREKTASGKLSVIYRLAHSFNRSHSCYHVHDDWRTLLSGFNERLEEEKRRDCPAPSQDGVRDANEGRASE